jgi:hypothetical protein
MSTNIVITDTNKRVMGLDDHYRQVLNGKLFYDWSVAYAWFGGGGLTIQQYQQ